MAVPESRPYERGDALDEAFADSPLDGPPRDEEELYDLSDDHYWAWLETLLDNGATLDGHLDELLNRIYKCQPAFYDWQGRQTLKELPDERHALRTSDRAFEQDVEQLQVAFARTTAMETEAAENAETVLSQIKSTYDRTYDLCFYKLDRMSDGWITATNLLISVTILVVTILFWMEFR